MNMPASVLEKVDLREYNSWKVGGSAEFFAAPKSPAELAELQIWAHQENLKIHLLSGGSNVLVPDGILPGLTICLRNMSEIISSEQKFCHRRKQQRFFIECLAGASKASIARVFLQNRLAPAVFLTGIPGDVGGGIVMNAGVGENRTPREFCEIVDQFKVQRVDETGNGVVQQIYNHPEVQWQYRHSDGWQPGIIVSASLSWLWDPKSEVMQELKTATQRRIKSQPLDMPSCGSVFRNPQGNKAAILIQNAGLKGFTIGGAQVSEKHANFIVNIGGATSRDMAQVIDHVKNTVQEKTGIDLVAEVVRW
jgi:UDP-N-acetylmuramate dehydrogenase